MTPLERAARDVAAITGTHCAGCQTEHSWDAEEIVRAVLLAIREPSEGMKSAGAENLFGSASENWGDDARQVYRAMIDKALEEG